MTKSCDKWTLNVLINLIIKESAIESLEVNKTLSINSEALNIVNEQINNSRIFIKLFIIKIKSSNVFVMVYKQFLVCLYVV